VHVIQYKKNPAIAKVGRSIVPPIGLSEFRRPASDFRSWTESDFSKWMHCSLKYATVTLLNWKLQSTLGLW